MQAGRRVHGEREKLLEVRDCVGRCSVSHKEWESHVEAVSLSELSLSCSLLTVFPTEGSQLGVCW